MEVNSQTDEIKKTVVLQRIYLKKLKFDTPNSPKILTDERKPESNMRLDSEVKELDKDIYEVTLTIKITNKVGEITAFDIEAEQAGVFTLRGFSEEMIEHMKSAYCPAILFPYLREVISGYASRAGFQQRILVPVNFDDLYTQRMRDKAKITQ